MPAASRLGDLSQGHDGFAPTQSVITPISTVIINGLAALTVNAEFTAHTSGNQTHPQNNRKVIAGSPDIFFEGKSAARVGDSISCGDVVGQGSPNVFLN